MPSGAESQNTEELQAAQVGSISLHLCHTLRDLTRFFGFTLFLLFFFLSFRLVGIATVGVRHVFSCQFTIYGVSGGGGYAPSKKKKI